MVTEAGMSDAAGYLDDSMRVYFYKYYINNILKGSINFNFVFKLCVRIYNVALS